MVLFPELQDDALQPPGLIFILFVEGTLINTYVYI